MKERRDLHRAPIGTIHAFCERVLREHALQAGIDPNFRMLDDAEAHTLQENALDVIFEDLWGNATTREREALGRLLLDYPQSELRKSLLGLFRDARTRGLAIDGIEVCPLPEIAEQGHALVTAVEALLALSGTPKWQEQLTTVRAALKELSPLLASNGFSWETYDRACVLRDDLLPSGGPKETAKAARDAVKASFATWLGAYLDGAMQPYAHAALTLLGRLAQAYQQAKTEKGLLDFEDLLLLTRDLLTGAHGEGAAEYYRQKFRQVMVDEFQDTNPLQFGIIDALAAGGHLFMVGDVKQSVYRFIGSDIRVFLAQERRILAQGPAGARLAMATNYRTRPEVLEPLNGLFSRLWPLAEETDRFTFEPLEAGQTFAPKAAPFIEWAFWSGEGSADDQRDQEAAWMARRILQVTGVLGEALPVTEKSAAPDAPPQTRPAAFRDIIILLRSFRDMPRYAEALRQAGVPLYVVGGRGFFQAREVQDVLHMLRVLENPLDDFSLAAVLRSPLVGVGDDTLYWLTRDWHGWTAGASYPAGLAQEGQMGASGQTCCGWRRFHR